MKGIRIGLLLVALASFAFGCSVAPETLPGRPAEPQAGHVAVTSVADGSTQTEPHSGLVWCGFAIRDFRVIRDEYGRVHAIGEVENVGEGTRGVELQASLRDASGRLVSVGHFCPAAGNNIAPGETWPFTYSFGRQDEGARGELRIVDAFHSMGGQCTTTGVR
jgi:hypothetical protein